MVVFEQAGLDKLIRTLPAFSLCSERMWNVWALLCFVVVVASVGDNGDGNEIYALVI